MKTHAIIPIFIPHNGCPHDCIFCNQKAITARSQIPTANDVVTTIETYLPTLRNRGLKTIEIAFYGGSFTGIPIEQQREYLRIAKQYKDRQLIDRIHLSTRPDYINDQILTILQDYSVDIIELGVQSFAEDVLQLCERGHNAQIVYQSAELIQRYGFTLGIQLMIGLPGDSYEKDLFSVQETIKIKPDLARLYPTVILRHTKLYDMYQNGTYHPLTLEEAVTTTKDMYALLRKAGIQVIRIGLKSTDLISEQGQAVQGTFHPAFRQLVEGELAKEMLEKQLLKALSTANSDVGLAFDSTHQTTHPKKIALFSSNNHNLSNMVGNKKVNRLYFETKYPYLDFRFQVNEQLSADEYHFCWQEPVR